MAAPIGSTTIWAKEIMDNLPTKWSPWLTTALQARVADDHNLQNLIGQSGYNVECLFMVALPLLIVLGPEQIAQIPIGIGHLRTGRAGPFRQVSTCLGRILLK